MNSANILRGIQIPDEGIEHLLGTVEASNHPIEVTFFDDHKAGKAKRANLSLSQLDSMFHEVHDNSKQALPMIKLGCFGDSKSAQGSLRSNSNLESVSGVEGDHDAGSMRLEDAAALLEKAGVAALVHETPSSTPDTPRWRVFAPLSGSVAPRERSKFAAKLNGILRGALATESFTPSQAFYFGKTSDFLGAQSTITTGAFLDCPKVQCHVPLGKDGKPLTINKSAIASEDREIFQPSDARVVDALNHIPIAEAEGEGGYDRWIMVGMALHSHFDGKASGFELWDQWSKNGKKYDPVVIQEKWESFSAFREERVGIGSIIKLAKDLGWSGVPTKKNQVVGLTVLSPDECYQIPPRPYVIKGFIAPADLACVFGKPGTGKSILAMHFAYAVAQGREVFGRKVRGGGVLYIPTEDISGMQQRVKALRQIYGPADDFGLVSEGVSDLLDPKTGQVDAIQRKVREMKPTLVIIDTLAGGFLGLQENDSADMGRVVAAARSICALGPAVVLVHHDVKNGGGTPRGHSVLNGSLETSLHLEKSSSGEIRGKLQKNKNGPQDLEIAFRIQSEEIGSDEDGAAVTAPIAEFLGGSARDLSRGLSRSARAVLDSYKTLSLLGGEVEKEELLSLAAEQPSIGDTNKRASRRTNANRGLKMLIERQILREDQMGNVSGPMTSDGFEEIDLI